MRWPNTARNFRLRVSAFLHTPQSRRRHFDRVSHAHVSRAFISRFHADGPRCVHARQGGTPPARPPTTPAGRSGLGVVTAGRERIEACRLSRSEPVMYRSSFGELVNRCSDSTATHRSSSRNSFSVGGGTVSQQGHCDTPSALCGWLHAVPFRHPPPIYTCQRYAALANIGPLLGRSSIATSADGSASTVSQESIHCQSADLQLV